MKVPAWAITVGIIMILMGGCSTLSDFSQINTKENIERQKEIFEEMSEEDESGTFEDIVETMEDILNMSEYTQDWLVRFGYIGMVISLLYILSGIFLISPKPFSVKLAYSILILSVVVTLLQGIVLAMDSEGSNMMSFSNALSAGLGILIDLILLVVILVSDKSVFLNQYE